MSLSLFTKNFSDNFVDYVSQVDELIVQKYLHYFFRDQDDSIMINIVNLNIAIKYLFDKTFPIYIPMFLIERGHRGH